MVSDRLLDVKEAQQRLLNHFLPRGEQNVPIHFAASRVLYRDVQADIDYPIFSNSAMDGFAVRSDDIQGAHADRPRQLQVVADIPAGEMLEITLQPGQASRIMTGAPIPDGADAVVPLENTDFNFRNWGLKAPTLVNVYFSEVAGAHIRPVGEDIQKGQVVLKAQKRLRAQDVGLLSMLGVETVQVYQKPRVAIFSCGDELLPVGEPIVPGKIHDANRYILMTLVDRIGAQTIDLGIVPDQSEQIEACLETALGQDADLILSSAGVSVGAFDFVRDVVNSNGSLEFWRVNMRPGKPIAFGKYRRTPFIGLPGNPVSAFVGFQVFVRPALRKMLGLLEEEYAYQRVKLLEPVSSDGRETYLRAIVRKQGDEMVASLTGHQGSGNLLSLVQANALLLVPSGVKSVPAGDYVEIWWMDEDGISSSRD